MQHGSGSFARGNSTSPATNMNIEKRLIPTLQARNMIERMVRSGAISRDKADAWCKLIADVDKEKELRHMADQGHAESISKLSFVYRDGLHGVPTDRALAEQIFQKAARVLLTYSQRHDTQPLRGDILANVFSKSLAGRVLAFFLAGWLAWLAGGRAGLPA